MAITFQQNTTNKKLEVLGDSIKLPSITTVQRDSLTGLTGGELVNHNGLMERFDGVSWVPLQGGESLLIEQIDHLQTPKPIRESPFSATDVYIKENQLGEGLVKTGNVFSVQETLFSADDFELVNGVLYLKNSPNIPATFAQFGGVGTQTGYNSTTTDHTLNFDSAPIGSLMFVCVSKADATNYDMIAPVGWDEIVNVSNSMQIFARKKESGDGSFIFTNDQLRNQSRGLVLPYFTNANYINGEPSTLLVGTPLSSSATVTRNIPSLSSASDFLAVAFAVSGGSGTTITVNTLGWNNGETKSEFFNSGFRASHYAYKETNAGATGDVEYTVQGTSNSAVIIGIEYQP